MTENEAICTIIEYRPIVGFQKYRDALNMAIQALEEIEQYRAIGTVEEFKDLKEKSVAKKPKMIGYRQDGEPVYECGCCGSTLKVVDQPFCMICRCKVYWSEE